MGAGCEVRGHPPTAGAGGPTIAPPDWGLAQMSVFTAGIVKKKKKKRAKAENVCVALPTAVFHLEH